MSRPHDYFHDDDEDYRRQQLRRDRDENDRILEQQRRRARDLYERQRDRDTAVDRDIEPDYW